MALFDTHPESGGERRSGTPVPLQRCHGRTIGRRVRGDRAPDLQATQVFLANGLVDGLPCSCATL